MRAARLNPSRIQASKAENGAAPHPAPFVAPKVPGDSVKLKLPTAAVVPPFGKTKAAKFTPLTVAPWTPENPRLQASTNVPARLTSLAPVMACAVLQVMI